MIRKILALTLIAFFFLVAPVFAGVQFIYPKFQGFDSNGNPLSGGLLYTYAANSATAKTTYSDRGLTAANTNPVVLNSRGEAVVYGSGQYKFILRDSAGSLIWTFDYLDGIGGYLGGNFYFPDAGQADQGAAVGSVTVKDFVDAIGATKTATIVFSRGSTGNNTDYIFLTSETITSNITCQFEQGARIAPALGITLALYSPANIIAQPNQQIKSGAGALAFATGGAASVAWVGMLPTATAAVNSAALNEILAAFPALVSCDIYIPPGAYELDSPVAKTAADYLHIHGDGWGTQLKWTGADDAVMLSLTGAGNGGLVVEDMVFDLNDKASTGLKTTGYGHIVTIKRIVFQKGKADVATGKLAMLDNFVETHQGLVEQCWFFEGTATGIGLNRAHSSGGPVVWRIIQNEFQSVDNLALDAGNINNIKISGNGIDGGAGAGLTNSAGYSVDYASHVEIEDNYAESLARFHININPTGAPATNVSSGVIKNNYSVRCNTVGGAETAILLGHTFKVAVENNSTIGWPIPWITVSANALGTILGQNTYSPDLAGTLSDSESQIAGAGIIGEPAFLARPTAQLDNVTGDATDYTVVFGTEIFDQNANFDGTSTFTAPLTGKYRLTAQLYVVGLVAAHNEQQLHIVTSNRTFSMPRIFAAGANPFTYADPHISVLTDMDVGDTAIVVYTVTGGNKVVDIGTNSFFCGELVRRKGYID